MRNEFMARIYGAPTCGTASGFMIPASAAYQKTNNVYKDLNFGDGTSMLGNYLAVLTTEFELLKKDNKNYTYKQLNDILEEIYWALKAYERLDKNAEVLFPPFKGSCPNVLNGFFVRDDVPREIVNKFPKRPNGTPKSIKDSDYERGHIATIEDVTVDDQNDNGRDELAVFPSADQITNLLVGFAMVKKKLNGVFWNGENLGMLANDYTDKIVSYTQSLGYDMRVPYDGRHTAFAGFSNFGRFGYGIAKAGNRIYKSSWGHKQVTSGSYDLGLNLSHLTFWSCLNYPSGKLEYARNYANSAYNNAIYSQLAAVGSSWEYGLLPEKCKEYYVPLPCFGSFTYCQNACAYCFDWGWASGCNCRVICGTFPFVTNWTACGFSVKLWHYVFNLPLCGHVPPLATSLDNCIYPVVFKKNKT